MILVDSDILTLFLLQNERILQRAAATAEPLHVPIVTRIELLRGRFDAVTKAGDAEQLRRALELLELTERTLSAFRVVSFDEGSLQELDRLRSNRKLKKIGLADLMIASLALANKATLVTRNVRHFSQITGVRIENWAD